MANLLNQNPIKITATMGSYKTQVATSQGSPNYLRIKEVYFENPTSVGDTALITDPASGIELLRLRCETANQSQIVVLHTLWQDFAVPELDSGTLYIFLE